MWGLDKYVYRYEQGQDQVRAGDQHSYARSDKTLWAWGRHHLQVDNTHTLSSQQQKMTQVNIEVQFISTAKTHTYAWKDNTVYSWGSNYHYQLGEDQQQNYALHKVQLFQKAFETGFRLQQISCGEEHTLAVNQDLKQVFEEDEPDQNNWRTETRLFGWGQSRSGQLTLDSSDIVPYPVISECTIHDIHNIHSKSDYNAVISTNGRVYTWGCNMFNRLGLNLIQADTPNKQTKIIKSRIPQQVPLACKIKKIGIGVYHVLAIGFEGELYSWGNGLHGQLGIGKFIVQSMPTKVEIQGNAQDVSCGEQHSVLLLADGRIMSCGSNTSGALGHQEHDPKDLKKRCKTFKIVKIMQKGRQLSCGNKHTLLLTNDGSVYAWGSNQFQQAIPKQTLTSKEQSAHIIQSQCQQQKNTNLCEDKIKVQFQNSINECDNKYKTDSKQVKMMKIKKWQTKFQQFMRVKHQQEKCLLAELAEIMGTQKT